jgi:circadian clock protein KaiB
MRPSRKTKELMLKLYISGSSPNSVRAITNLRQICDTYLPSKYILEIIDVHQDTAVAIKEQLVALPLLIKEFPLPIRKLIGDMSDTKKVLSGLGLKYKAE